MKKTLASIEAEIARLKGMADKIYKDEVAGVVDRIRTAIQHYGLTAADLGFGAAGAGGRKAKGAAVAGTGKVSKTGLEVGVARYRDPATGKTWTGRGKPPNWIASAANRDVFLIDGAAAAASGAAAPAGKRQASAKSTSAGVAKYQDPATGKTWTGRGKPPAWIAGAANRDAFLIGGSEAEASGIEMTGAPAADAAPAAKRKGAGKGRAAAKKGGRRKAAAQSADAGAQ